MFSVIINHHNNNIQIIYLINLKINLDKDIIVKINIYSIRKISEIKLNILKILIEFKTKIILLNHKNNILLNRKRDRTK
jgi:hypothetical protein